MQAPTQGINVYVLKNPASNDELKKINDRWEDVQSVITDLSDDFSNASQAAEYYFYSADADLITLLTDEDEAYYENYTQEDLDLIAAFMDPTTEDAKSTIAAYRLDFSALYEESGETTVFWNTESAFYSLLGTVDEDEEESLSDSLKGAYLQSTAEDVANDAWTWQWAAIFVPVGVVVIVGVVLAIVLPRRRRHGVR